MKKIMKFILGFVAVASEREQFEKEMPVLWNERAGACYGFAFAEVVSYNKASL